MTVEIDLLRNVGKQALGLEGIHRYINAAHGHASAVRCYKSKRAVDRCRFPGPVGAEQGENLSPGDCERNIVHRGDAVEALGQTFGA